MKKLYNKYRHGIFEEAEIAMPVIQRYGTGGGNVPIVVEVKTFNQVSQSAVYREDDIAVSTTVCGGSYGGGQRDINRELSR